MKSLFGIIPDDGTTLEQAREERLAKYESKLSYPSFVPKLEAE
jgi:hypothetical protein